MRDAALALHEATAADRLEMVRDALRATARARPGGTVSANDARTICDAMGLETGNWMGALFRGAEWEATGDTIRSTGTGRHASRIMVWRLVAAAL